MVTLRVPCMFSLRFQAFRRSRFALMTIPLIVAFVCVVGVGLARAGGDAADLEKNKRIVTEWIEEVVKKANFDHHDKYAHEDIMIRLPHNWKSPTSGTNTVQGKDNVKKHFQTAYANWKKKAEDVGLEIYDMIAEGDKVAVYGQRVFRDLKTGTEIRLNAMGFYKIKDGKVAEIHTVYEGLPSLKK